MSGEVSGRQRWVEDEVERLTHLVALGLPCVLAVVALVVPMFSYVDVGEDVQDPTLEQATLLGLVADPGETGATGWIVATALVLLVSCWSAWP